MSDPAIEVEEVSKRFGEVDAADLLLTGTWTIGLLAVVVPRSAWLYTEDAS